MPIRMRPEHFEFPKRLELAVLTEQPPYTEDGFQFGPKTCRTIYPAKFKEWFFCHHCKGWIEGSPHAHRVNTLDGSRLAGRKGTEYYCLRCGEEIGFSGMMS